MKAVSLLVLFLSFNSFGKTILLTNTLKFERIDEPIVLQRSELGEIPADKIPVIVISNNRIPSQADDLNGDGVWDELAFEYSFKPQEKIKLSVEFISKENAPVYPKKTKVRLGKRGEDGNYYPVTYELHPKEHIAQSEPFLYQFEGPGWENDVVAFRQYLDSRNGKDIYGKKTSKLMIDSIGVMGSYHDLQWWGMDVLKVGNSLGAGGYGWIKDGKILPFREFDSLVFVEVSDGPVRSIFRIEYKGVMVNDKEIDVVEQNSIWAGKYWYKRDIYIGRHSGCDTLATGIVNLKAHSTAIVKRSPKGMSWVALHDKLSENHDYLGMAVIVADNQVAEFGRTPVTATKDEFTHSDYVSLPYCENKGFTTYFLAGWEMTDEKLAEKETFLNLVEMEALRLGNPVRIK